MISSTAIDLPEHRKVVFEACLREGFFPIGMESLPARDVSGVHASLEMVGEADVYIGVYAWRYGWVPEGSQVSITEMEFDRALERKTQGQLLDIIVFVMDERHPLQSVTMVEADAVAQAKLKEFKDRATSGRIRGVFTSADDLKGQVIHALSDIRRRLDSPSSRMARRRTRPPRLIPDAPSPFVAHPYSLLQTRDVIGRRDELSTLTDWITNGRRIASTTRIVSVVAMGGMGKSALTWKWFNDIAPSELPDSAGRMWWSFYEPNAQFESFVVAATVYVTGRPEPDVRQMPATERERLLLEALDAQPFLIVLDGLERILLAYSRDVVSRIPDDEIDSRTAHSMLDPEALSRSGPESYLDGRRLRSCADPRAGSFLARLSRLRASRILISSRLHPSDLETSAMGLLPHCETLVLRGLADDDALTLWREFVSGAKGGTSEQLLPLFRSFENHPLLLRALAGEVAGFRSSPGDLSKWIAAHPEFDPLRQRGLRDVKRHVLAYALRGLGRAQRKVLNTIAAFRMSAPWETLRALLIGDGRPCANDSDLSAVLMELEDRGLVGWDKGSNRYDLHPVVRSAAWDDLAGNAKKVIYGQLHDHLRTVCPPMRDFHGFDSLPRTMEELSARIELHHVLVGLGRHEEAVQELYEYMEWIATALMGAGAGRELIQMLEMLFPNGLDEEPRGYSSFIYRTLGAAHSAIGEPGLATNWFRRVSDIDSDGRLLLELSRALMHCGNLREAEIAALKAIAAARRWDGTGFYESIDLMQLSECLLLRGATPEARVAHRRALKATGKPPSPELEILRGMVHMSEGEFRLAKDAADAAIEIARQQAPQRGTRDSDVIKAERLRGIAMLRLGDSSGILEPLYHAMASARAMSLVAEELPLLIALAHVHLQRGEFDASRDVLRQAIGLAERGPYKVCHADALNVLAQLEIVAGHRDKAVEAATEAYRKAAGTGFPFVYAFGLSAAGELLARLSAPTPVEVEVPIAESTPWPSVELNPRDKFHVDLDT